MSTVNKVLLACLLVALVVTAVVLLHSRAGQTDERTVGPTLQAVPTPATSTVAATTPVRTIRPTPVTVKPIPTPVPGTAPVDEATQVAAIREAILGEDATKREQGLGELATLLTEGKGISLLKELVASDKKELQDEALSLLPNLPEDLRLSILSLGLDAKDPEFRAEMLTQVRDVISSDPEKVALNDLMLKAMKDPDPSVQEEAADLFMYFGDAEHDGPIYKSAYEGLSNANETIRENAMSYLEDNHTVQSILMLTEALNSKFPDIVEKAGDALRFITDAEIPSNKYEDWTKWCNEHGTEWGMENDRTLP